jgi:arylsulfatase A-like enzyme
VNVLPFLSGQQAGAPHERLFWRSGGKFAVREGDWKLVGGEGGGVQLFNLAADIGETKDLAAGQSDKSKELQAKWDAWNATLAAPLWGGKTGSSDREPGKAAKGKRRKNQSK